MSVDSIWRGKADISRAERMISRERARKMLPTNLYWADAHLEFGHATQAREFAKNHLISHPDDPRALLLLTQIDRLSKLHGGDLEADAFANANLVARISKNPTPIAGSHHESNLLERLFARRKWFRSACLGAVLLLSIGVLYFGLRDAGLPMWLLVECGFTAAVIEYRLREKFTATAFLIGGLAALAWVYR